MLPPPPPPSPSFGNMEGPQTFDEALFLSAYALAKPRGSHVLCESMKPARGVGSNIPHSTLAKFPLHPITPRKDFECTRAAASDSLVNTLKSAGINKVKVTGKRRVTAPEAPLQLKSPSSSATQCVFELPEPPSPKPIPAEPAATTCSSCVRSTAASRFRSRSNPRLVGRRQISSPLMTSSSASPTDISPPRSLAPSRAQSRSGSLSTSTSSELLLQQKEEEVKSYFSDSEDDEKTLSKKGLLGGSQGRHSRRFRRRLSETFAFLSCGAD